MVVLATDFFSSVLAILTLSFVNLTEKAGSREAGEVSESNWLKKWFWARSFFKGGLSLVFIVSGSVKIPISIMLQTIEGGQAHHGFTNLD